MTLIEMNEKKLKHTLSLACKKKVETSFDFDSVH